MIEDVMRPAALTVAFLILVGMGDRQKWFVCDALVASCFGLLYLVVPSIALSGMVKGELDEGALLLGRLYGMALIGTAVMWLLTRQTRDGTVHIALIVARILSISVGLLAQAYTYWGTSVGKRKIDWTPQFVSFGMYGQLLWLLANVYFMMRSDDFCTYPQHNIRINTHLRLDAAMSLLIALVFLAFPDMLIKAVIPFSGPAPSCVHLHVCRSVGALLLSPVFVALHAPGFLHEADKRAHFTARIMVELLLWLPMLATAGLSPSVSAAALAKLLAATSPCLVNAAVGLLADGNVIYRVPDKKTE